MFHGTSLFRAVSGAFPRLHRASVAAETSLRGTSAAADAEVSRGAFGGQHFPTTATRSIAWDVSQLALLRLKPEQLALFGPVGGEFESQAH